MRRDQNPNAHFAREVSKYLVFGVLTTLINLACYSWLVMLEIHYGIATSIAFVIAVLFAYVTNKRFVFESKVKGLRKDSIEMASFFGSRLVTFGIETAGLVLLIEIAGFGEQFSKYAMTGVVVILNYLISKRFVFRS